MRYFSPVDPYVEDGSRSIYRLPDNLNGEYEVIGDMLELGFFVPETDPMCRVVGTCNDRQAWINPEFYEEITGNDIKQFQGL